MLQRIRKDTAIFLAAGVVFVNVAVMAYLVYYFRTDCTMQYGVLPNDWTMDTPASLQSLQDKDGVTIVKRMLVFYQENESFSMQPDVTRSFWSPWVMTCGCGVGSDDCDLAFCGGSTPINVEYE